MISSSEKDTSLKLEALRAWDQKSEVWNVVGQRTIWAFWRVVFELNSHCKKRGRTKETLSCINVYFLSTLL